MQLQPGTCQSRYIIDDQWLNDPKCREPIPNEFGTLNAVITIGRFGCNGNKPRVCENKKKKDNGA
ncbi:MAG: hypothetical protein EHM45_11230 [Desulfobacteraceae bacterium]|nr:MAG: hypothetical protein EHM45_11230 [Desulfobacteraceae bacterium]